MDVKTVRATLDEAVAAEQLNSPVVRLAEMYADVIDLNSGDDEVLAQFGPKYLAALVALGFRADEAKRGAPSGDGNIGESAVISDLRKRRKDRSG